MTVQVLAFVEGQTEEQFVTKVLAPSLDARSIHVSATMIGKPGHQGGVRPWRVARRDILAALKQLGASPNVDSTGTATNVFLKAGTDGKRKSPS